MSKICRNGSIDIPTLYIDAMKYLNRIFIFQFIFKFIFIFGAYITDKKYFICYQFYISYKVK